MYSFKVLPMIYIASKKLALLISNKILCPFRSIDQNEKVCQKGCLPTMKPCPIGEKCEMESSTWDVGIYG